MPAAISDDGARGAVPCELEGAFHDGPDAARADAAPPCPGLTIARRRVLSGIVLSDVLAPADGVSEWHVHAEGGVVLAIVAGCLIVRTPAGDAMRNAGSVHIQPRGHCHRLRVGRAGVRAMVVELSERWSSRLAHDAAVGADASREAFVPAMRLYHELASWSASSPLTAEGIVLGMLGAMTQRETRRIACEEPIWLATAEAYIRRNLGRTLSLSDVAAAIRVGPAYLSRAWQHFRGGSVAEWLRRARVEVACCRIAARGAALSDVARELGFADQTHFTRAFRQVTGMTPGDFRTALVIPRDSPQRIDPPTRGSGPLHVPRAFTSNFGRAFSSRRRGLVAADSRT